MKDYIAEAREKVLELEKIRKQFEKLSTERYLANNGRKGQNEFSEEKYQITLKEWNDVESDTWKILENLKEHSFFGDDIWHYIVLLMSMFEGREYCYKLSYPGFVDIGCYEKALFRNAREQFEVKLTFKDSYFQLYYFDLFNRKYKVEPTIDFKTIDVNREYGYVLRYLNALVNYRIANNINSYAPMDRYALEVMKDFIDENRDLLKEIRALRVSEEEQKMDNYFAGLLENLEETTGRKA